LTVGIFAGAFCNSAATKGLVQQAVCHKRGCNSSDSLCGTASLALVQALPIPPPAASCQPVICHFGTAQCDWEAKRKLKISHNSKIKF